MADCPPCQTVRADAEIMLRGSFDPVYPASHLDPNQRLARARWPERDGLDLKHFGLEKPEAPPFTVGSEIERRSSRAELAQWS